MKQRTDANNVREEFDKAKAKGRQPTCPYCGVPLEISQTQCESTNWKWNNKKKIYEKEVIDIDPDIPYCTSCKTEDWNFLNSGLMEF